MANSETDWGAAADAVLQQEQEIALRQSVRAGLGTQPQQEAQARKLARDARVPMETARSDPQGVSLITRMGAIDFAKLQREAPATAAWLASDVNNGRIAAQNLPQLTQMERAVQELTKPSAVSVPADERSLLGRITAADFWIGQARSVAGAVRYLRGGVDAPDSLAGDLMGAARYIGSGASIPNSFAADAVGATRSVSGKVGFTGALAMIPFAQITDAAGLTSGSVDAAAGWAKFYADQVDREAQAEAQSAFHQKLVRAAVSLGVQLPAILATGGSMAAPTASMSVRQAMALAADQGIKGMAVPATLEAVNTMRRVYAETGDIAQSANAAGAQYATSSAAGVLPLSVAGAAFRRLTTGAAIGAVQGDVSRQAMNLALPQSLQTDFNWEDIAIGAVTGSLMAGVMGPRAEVQRAAAIRAHNEAFDAARSEVANAQVAALAKMANESELRRLDAATFHQWVENLAGTDALPAELHIDASRLVQVLREHNVTDADLAQTMPKVAEQLAQVRDVGGPDNAPIAIPVADFATHIAGSKLEQPLLQELRATPGGHTVAETEAIRQGRDAQLAARAQELTADFGADAAYQDSLRQLDDTIDTNMAGLNMRPEQWGVNRTLLRAYYQVQAERVGVLPHEFAAQYPVFGGRRWDDTDAPIELPMRESAAQRDARVARGDVLVSIDAKALRDMLEAQQGAPLVPEVASELGVLDAAPGVFIRADAGVEIRDGGQHIAYAADKGLALKVAVSPADVARLEDLGLVRRGKALAQGQTHVEVDGVQRSTVNSEGQPLAQTSEEVRNFWRWFGNSKVVDAKGRPLVMYHGTLADFDTFRDNERGVHFVSPSRQWVEKFMRTDEGSLADGANVMPVYVKASNPFDFKEKKHVNVVAVSASLSKSALDEIKKGSWSRIEDRTTLAAIKRRFDGVHVLEDGHKNLAVFDPAQIKSAIGNRGTFDPQDANVLHQTAYHGTPHRGIDQFSTAYMGSGEGAQAYGWGLYFASRRGVAESYRKTLTESLWRDLVRKKHSLDYLDAEFTKKWRTIKTQHGPELGEKYRASLERFMTVRNVAVEAVIDGDPAAARDNLVRHMQEHEMPPPTEKELMIVDRLAADISQEAAQQKRGQTYKVDVPENDVLLDWDAPVANQPPAVRKVLDALGAQLEEAGVLAGYLARKNVGWQGLTGGEAYKVLKRASLDDALSGVSREVQDAQAAEQDDKAASLYLRDAGLAGIRYLDGGSRAAGKGTHNYVIFHGDDVAIREQFHQFAGERAATAGSPNLEAPRQPSQGPRGAYNPETKVITLTPRADLSTFQHELGHFFLDTTLTLAARIEAMRADGAGLGKGEEEILADAAVLLKWGGVTDLADWHARDVDQQRELHEKFATGFETYLMKGDAPSLELRGVFARLRAWMVRVYKSLKGAPGSFTPEVRGVMDRMVASEDAIREAQLARKYLPLFKKADDSAMEPAQWREYQDAQAGATEQAIAQLTAATLRDMARIDRLRDKALERVRAEAKDKLKAIEREVRRDVMSQPLYRAWAFLTAKGEADRQAVGASDAPKPRPQDLDVTKDSLLTAIAKLGGIDRESARRDLGVHQDYHRMPSGVFGRPIWRKSGGLSAEYMAEALAEQHYLPPNYSLRDLEDAIGDELAGFPRYSWAYDYAAARGEGDNPGAQAIDTNQYLYGKLKTSELKALYGDSRDAPWRELVKRRMTNDKTGLHPDVVAETFGFESGDDLVRALASAPRPDEVIRGMADQLMLERHGEVATPEAMAAKADELIASEVRTIILATELRALNKAVGKPSEVAEAAREVASQTVEAQQVRAIRPDRYAAASTRAARDAERALAKGDMQGAAVHKRDQILNLALSRAASQGREYVESAINYLKKFESPTIHRRIPADYMDQIEQLLERYDLRKGVSGAEIDRRKSLAAWLEAQAELGLEPDIPEKIANESRRVSYKELRLEELRGLVDSIKQIEHLGRTKAGLLASVEQRAYEAVRDAVLDGLRKFAGGRKAAASDLETATTRAGRTVQGMKRFGWAHIKAAAIARTFDGGHDGGEFLKAFILPANKAADWETQHRGIVTTELHEILSPLGGDWGGKGQRFDGIDIPLNRQQRFAIALNMGNEGNIQRLLDGRGWSREAVNNVLKSMSEYEARAVQRIWNLFESYRPLIADQERRIYGKEPEWVKPSPVVIGGIELDGGYYPAKYDPRRSGQVEAEQDADLAKAQLRGAVGAATVRRSFAKARASEVQGRAILLSLDGIYESFNEVLHALAWTEHLIDMNKLLRPGGSIETTIRELYGPDVLRQLKMWREDIARGDAPGGGEAERWLGWLRRSVSVAGLGFNIVNALMQPLGFTQSVQRIGAGWVGRGLARYVQDPRAASRLANEKSQFMTDRARTRLRELAEIRNMVADQSAIEQWVGRNAYRPMLFFQRMVDVPTWWGAYEKAMAEGRHTSREDGSVDDSMAVALADQAVRDAQGSGHTSDLSAVERGGPAAKLFTVFYSFFNTAANLGFVSASTPKSRARLAADMLLLYIVPAVLGAMYKDAIVPGDSGDWDSWDEALKTIAGEQLGYLMGLMVGVREFAEAGRAALGLSAFARDYQGPGGTRLIVDVTNLGKQVGQGEFDDQLRKASVNVAGSLLGLPAAQINRTITGTAALVEGETVNPAAVLLGYQQDR